MHFIDGFDDPWRALPDGALADNDIRRGHWLFSPAQWRPMASDWLPGCPFGLLLPNTLDLVEITAVLTDGERQPQVIALQFPKWSDGRAYAQARMLRARFGYDGQVRAVGDVVADMLPLLRRTGFDAVALRADQNLAAAQRALGFFAAHDHGDVLQPKPLFARPAA